MGEQAGSLVEQVLAQCAERFFTGVLTVRTSRGAGVVQLLSGVQEDAAYADLRGEEALQALTQVKVDKWTIRTQLPPLRQEDPELPLHGDLARYSASELMRHCEEHALTGRLILEADGLTVTATYQMGELAGLEPDNDETAELMVAEQGQYHFELPTVTLPPLHAGAKRSASTDEEVTAPGIDSPGELQQWADSAPPVAAAAPAAAAPPPAAPPPAAPRRPAAAAAPPPAAAAAPPAAGRAPLPPPPAAAPRNVAPAAAPPQVAPVAASPNIAPAPAGRAPEPRVDAPPRAPAKAQPKSGGMRPAYLWGLAAVAMLVGAAVTFLMR